MIDLKQKYDREKLVDFISADFLPDFEKDVRSINVSNNSSIKKAYLLGKSKILDLDIFEFEITGSTEKRVMITKDAFSILKNSSIYRALAIFKSTDNEDWRFSLMISTPIISDKGKLTTVLSNLKRYSFFLGPKAKVKTPIRFLLEKGKVISFENLKERFSIEVVNKEFYSEISKLFTELIGGTYGNGKQKKEYFTLLELPGIKEKSKQAQEFAVRLIGRIIFCWFLREKHDGSKDSLIPKSLFSLKASEFYKDYYHSVLENIFFELLNKPLNSRKLRLSSEEYLKIPYLNGGLFSPHEYDFYSSNESKQEINKNKVIVPNSWIIKLFEILETYNFTIDENTGYDEELSIDPEMLGRIFENLLAEINPETGESARKSTGSYYTPRIIVDYMVDESIYLYLKERTGIKEEKLRSLISYDLDDNLEYPLNDEEKEKITQTLGVVKILDPACGSGAFPIGTLQKIVFILQQVDPNAKKMYDMDIKQISPEYRRFVQREYDNGNFDYLRKLRIIRDCIYGVDIQPIATEISRLRCFLTLVVEQKIDDTLDNRGIQPLPNLDFKFVTANSLIGLPKIDNTQPSMFDDYEKIDELKSIRDQYFNASGLEREKLKTEFVTQQKKLVDELISKHGFMGVAKAELTKQLTNWEPFTHKPTPWFNIEWMFGIKDGFDIVIGNPPYVGFGVRNSEKISQSYKSEIIKLYPNSAEYKINLYPLFIERALMLCKERGIQSYIVPDSFLLGKYFSKIRKYILDTVQISKVLLFSEPVFEAVVGYSVVYVFRKTMDKKSTIDVIKVNDPDLTSLKEFSYPQSTFEKTKLNRFRLFSNAGEKNLVEKIEEQKKSVSDLIEFKSGLISKIGQKEIISNEKKGEEWRPGVVSGGEIRRYSISWDGNYIRYKKELIKSGFGNVSYFENKIFVRQTGDKIISAFDDTGYLCLNNVHVGNIVNKIYTPETIISILNSKLINKYYEIVSLEKGRVMAQIDIDVLDSIPVPSITTDEESNIKTLVDQILTLKKQNKDADTKNLESQIDQLIYKLYDLTPEEIEIVENSSKK